MDRVAGITSNTVPWEILRAAGYTPRLIPNEPGPTPYADRFMEDVFEPRFRVAFDRLCTGSWTDIDVVVIPRTSEQEHKLYLYLREVSRLGYSKRIPRLYLYNLLHSRSTESYSYGLERTRQMVRDFQASDDGLWEAIAESNSARAAVRAVLELRQQGQLEGSEAIEMIGGFYTGDRRGFAEQMRQKVSVFNTVTPVDRPRILIKGASLPDTTLHRLIEQNGGYVSAEDDWRGSRAAGELDICTEGDPVAAVFDKYYYDAVSPRVLPPEEADAWFRTQIEHGQVEGVLFHLPLQDDVVGWDYPRHLAFVQSRGVPSLLVRESGAPEPGSGVIAQVSAFVRSLRRV